MANSFETLEGTLYWTKVIDLEETPFKDKKGNWGGWMPGKGK